MAAFSSLNRVVADPRRPSGLLAAGGMGYLEFAVKKKQKKHLASLPEVYLSLSDWLDAREVLEWTGPFLEFSTNPQGQVWPVPGRGHSDPQERRTCPQLARTLGDAVHAYLRLRDVGGRFRLDFTRRLVIRHVDGVAVARLQYGWSV